MDWNSESSSWRKTFLVCVPSAFSHTDMLEFPINSADTLSPLYFPKLPSQSRNKDWVDKSTFCVSFTQKLAPCGGSSGMHGLGRGGTCSNCGALVFRPEWGSTAGREHQEIRSVQESPTYCHALPSNKYISVVERHLFTPQWAIILITSSFWLYKRGQKLTWRLKEREKI